MAKSSKFWENIMQKKQTEKNCLLIKGLGALLIVGAVVWAYSKNIFNFEAEHTETVPTSVFDADGYWHTDDFVAKLNKDGTISYFGTKSLYGAYLAARIAHMRQDFDAAAEYYKIVSEKDANKKSAVRSVYIILSSLGHIKQAAPYAQKEIDANTPNTLAPVIVAIEQFSQGKYAEARESMNKMTDQAYKNIFNPWFNAWTYAGEQNEAEAIASIDKIIEDPSLNSVKLFHKGMIYDYLGNREKAAEAFATIVSKYPSEVTYRILEVITDFYVRGGDKNLARQISGRYNDNSILSVLLADIDKKIDAGKTNTQAIIDTPQKGLAEALFNIGTLFRASSGGMEFAQIYIAASSYLNPDYEVSKIAMANILEELGLLKEANRYYAQVQKDSGSYFISRLKMIENMNTLKDYIGAEHNLKILLQDYPDNTQLLSDLGNIASTMNKDVEAIEIYQKALKNARGVESANWPIYYALAVSYTRTNQKLKAEENLRRALNLSNRNPNVLNYLGYSWLQEGKNIEEAVQMIVEAYRHAPYEGHIIDSLGWVFYRLGQYDKAIGYLEQASDMNPGNAVISDHLGDAYWFGGRKNEAVFQWKHALVLKEDSEMLEKDAVRKKIENNAVENEVLIITDPLLLDLLTNLKPNEENNEAKK